MKRLITLLFLCVAISNGRAQSFSPSLAAVLQFKLDSMVSLFSNTKGMAVGVHCPGQGVWTGASGLSYGGVPLASDMAFGLASNSKLFTSVVMLKLAEQNILSLDLPISTWLPTYANVNPAITVRQLLNHSSGISDPFFVTSLLDSILAHPTHYYDLNEVMTYVGPAQFAPGTGYGYSNINYILASEVARVATGQHISQLIRDIILTPLSMDSTFYDLYESETGVLAHRWYQGVDFNDTSRVSLNSSGGAAGALFSTPAEVAQWYIALMSGQIINAASLAQMTTFTGSGNYGLGIARFTFFGNTCWGHGGSTLGYKSRIIYDPCMQTVVCGLSNSDPSAVDGVTAILYKAIVDRVPRCPSTIQGAVQVCQGQHGVQYTIAPIANATSYVWSLPSGATGVSSTNSITVDFGVNALSGAVSVKGVNAFGESAVATFAVTVNQLPAQPIVTVTGNQLHSSANSGNQWYDENGAINGATGQDLVAVNNGIYHVVVTLNGCSSGASAPIAVLVTGTDARSSEREGLFLYPNPVGEEVRVLGVPVSGVNTAVELCGVDGRTIRRVCISSAGTVDVSSLRPGVYLLKFTDREQVLVERFVKL